MIGAAGLSFERVVVSMNTNRTRSATDCAHLRAIGFDNRTRVADREYAAALCQRIPSVVRLSRGARVKPRVMQRIYENQQNQAVKVSLHISEDSGRRIEAYV
jgi:hypothetical protein